MAQPNHTDYREMAARRGAERYNTPHDLPNGTTVRRAPGETLTDFNRRKARCRAEIAERRQNEREAAFAASHPEHSALAKVARAFASGWKH